jgi:[ribosomal protein S5]-alanine N-acetyltransferase
MTLPVPFLLRSWRQSDLTDLVRFANNPNIARNLTNAFPHPYTEDAGKKFIEMAMTHDPIRILVIEIDGVASGGIGIHPQSDVYCKNAELGYWLAEPYWGKGIMTEAIREVVHRGFSNFDITRIYARPYGSNIASQKVLEKAGFVLEARIADAFYKNGRYEDELIYGIRKNEANGQ